MKNHLTLLGLSFVLCTFIVAQAGTAHRLAPAKNTVGTYQQDTSKHKMKKQWKKDKDTSWRRDTSAMPTKPR
jgi:hypothetical protein